MFFILVVVVGILMSPLLLTTCVHAAIVINEIMYHHPANEMFDFVELVNTDAVSASIAGWRLKIGQFSICPHHFV